MRQEAAMSRLDRPHSHLRRSTSRIVRMDNLLLGIVPSFKGGIAQGRGGLSHALRGCALSFGTGALFRTEWMRALRRNHCALSSGLDALFRADFAEPP